MLILHKKWLQNSCSRVHQDVSKQERTRICQIIPNRSLDHSLNFFGCFSSCDGVFAAFPLDIARYTFEISNQKPLAITIRTEIRQSLMIDLGLRVNDCQCFCLKMPVFNYQFSSRMPAAACAGCARSIPSWPGSWRWFPGWRWFRRGARRIG